MPDRVDYVHEQIADKQIEVLGSFLKDEDLSIPMTSDSHVTDSTESPFSDKLIIFHITAFSSLSQTALGLALVIAKEMISYYQ